MVQAAAASGAFALDQSVAAPSADPTPLRVLILGGTGNIGPYHVRAAVARGHHVSVFSRGRSAAELPSGVEHLVGDRDGDLNSIHGRDWDAVLDIATFGPGWVRTLGEALKGRVGHYTFISTVSVYDNPAANKITDEASRVLAYQGSADPYSVIREGQDYGALKVLCEREAESQFPGAALVIRPGYIAGPGDTHPPLPYWLLRMRSLDARSVHRRARSFRVDRSYHREARNRDLQRGGPGARDRFGSGHRRRPRHHVDATEGNLGTERLAFNSEGQRRVWRTSFLGAQQGRCLGSQ
jgi:nucleoside-diphosphate-sugar epimerase